jgi:hypothetical protein
MCVYIYIHTYIHTYIYIYIYSSMVENLGRADIHQFTRTWLHIRCTRRTLCTCTNSKLLNVGTQCGAKVACCANNAFRGLKRMDFQNIHTTNNTSSENFLQLHSLDAQLHGRIIVSGSRWQGCGSETYTDTFRPGPSYVLFIRTHVAKKTLDLE